jgi:hypothetical protein
MKALDWLENFYFKYFSSSTLDDRRYNWVRYVWFGIMFIPFSLGFLFTVLGFIDLIRFFVHILMWMFIPFAVGWIVVWFYHNSKLKKLRKKWR